MKKKNKRNMGKNMPMKGPMMMGKNMQKLMKKTMGKNMMKNMASMLAIVFVLGAVGCSKKQVRAPEPEVKVVEKTVEVPLKVERIVREYSFPNIYFGFDSDRLGSFDRQQLSAVVGAFMANTKMRFLLIGNTDERGSREYNERLGGRRAEAVKKFLVEQGVRAEFINVLSLGELAPVCGDRSEKCWKLNRRVEVRVR